MKYHGSERQKCHVCHMSMQGLRRIDHTIASFYLKKHIYKVHKWNQDMLHLETEAHLQTVTTGGFIVHASHTSVFLWRLHKSRCNLAHPLSLIVGAVRHIHVSQRVLYEEQG